MYSLALPKANWGEEMKVCCPHCSQIVVIEDADVKSYTAKLARAVPSAKRDAGMKGPRPYAPRPNSKGNTRAKKKEVAP